MKEWLFGWVQDIAFYTLLMVVVVHTLPEKHLRKYLQFFMGIVMILVVLSPALRLTGMERKLDAAYVRHTYDQELQEFLQEQERLELEYERWIRMRLEEENEQEAEAIQEAETVEQKAEELEQNGEQEAENDHEQKGAESGIWQIRIEIDGLEED